MKFSCKKILLTGILLSLSFISQAEDYLIFSVAEDLPMGVEKEILRRNYYLNMGADQGLKNGTILKVYRMVSKSNPYDNKKRVNYKIPIGTLEVIHTEEDSAVALRKELYDTAKDPIFDINNFMIGDHIAINLD